MAQEAQTGALYQPRGVGQGRRWEGSSKGGDICIPIPIVMYGYESWTVKKAERRRINAFELWCWRRLLRVPWPARRSTLGFLWKKRY